MSAPLAVALDAISKRYVLYRRRAGGLKDRLVNALRGQGEQRDVLWALRGVSLGIPRGETLALIGPNGCGKSTLLQLVAGILEPDEGTARVAGRVTSLLELGAGFSPDLSGRENIYLNASLHGLTRTATDRVFDAIVDFAELARFIDMPVRNYSSGMYMRLGIAVAVHLDPEIVLIDEAFAVGDEAFQRKCLRKMKEFQARGLTIVLVSHDLLLVERIATRACLLMKGEVAAEGRPADVIARYHQLAAAEGQVAGEIRWGSREITIAAVAVEDGAGRPLTSLRTGEGLTVALHYEAARRVVDPVFGLAVYRDDGVHLTGPNTRMNAFPIAEVEGAGTVRYHVPRVPLLPGRYLVSASVYDHDLAEAYDHRERVATFSVIEGGTLERFGLITLDGAWQHARGAAPPPGTTQ